MLSDNIKRRKDRLYTICHTTEYIVETEYSQEKVIELTVNISNSGLCCYTFKTLSEGQEIRIKRTPSLSYQPAIVQWIQKATNNIYKVGLSF